jgi:hypothetical protein
MLDFWIMRHLLPVFILAAAAQAQIYVAPDGDDAGPGTESQPARTLTRARDLARARNQALATDLTVRLAPGIYRLTQPLLLDERDSGSNGHNVVYTAAVDGQYPVLSGAVRVTGWKLVDRGRNLWSAAAPDGLGNTRQIYVDGVRAHRARGRLPVEVTQTATGYTASSPAMAAWRNPSDIEFVYTGGNSIWSERSEGLGAWTEPRCPVAAIQDTAIAMAQPCWANSTGRILLPSGERAANLVGGASVGKQPAYIENAYELLGTPGEWYFDRPARVLYYVPRAGEDLTQADVEAPAIETLIEAAGTAEAPIHNVVFSGLQFSYATWLRPSTPEGFSEIQANYTLTGPHAWATEGLCKLVPDGECPYGSWTATPGNVRLRYSRDVQFRNDIFTHLGAAGLDLGDGAQNDSVEGCAFTDISGSGVELGAVDKPLAIGGDVTRDNRIRNNHIWNIGAEYRGGIGIVVGYAQRTAIEHNQIDHTPYTAISMGWGGWPDKIGRAGQANYSENNRVANNRIFDFMLVLADGGGIYTQGLTGPDLKRGEKVTGNVISEQFGSGHGVYTDNGSCNITVAGNVMFHLNFDNWGSRHRDYYNGADGSANDPLDILNNYWQQGDADASAKNVTLRGNRIIGSLDQAPRAVLNAAGLEPEFKSLLDRHFAPATPPEPPSRVAAVAGNGYALVTWSPPVFVGESPVESYTVTAWTHAPGGPSGPVAASAGAPGAGPLSAGARGWGSPSAEPLSAGSPSLGSPTAGSPTAGAPSAGSPTVGSPSAGAPSAGSPTAGSPSAGAPSAGLPGSESPSANAPAAPAPAAPVVSATLNAGTVEISADGFRTIGFVKLAGLKNGTEYTFTVTARNRDGRSVASLPSHAVSPNEEPLGLPAPPVNVRALADSGGRASIHFQDPAAVDKMAPGAPIVGYTIAASPGGKKLSIMGRNVLALEGTAHTTFAVMEGLKAGETYTFSVVAVNPEGDGAPAVSSPVTIPKR